MSFAVRIYGISGLARIPVTNDGGTAGQDSVYVTELPVLWNQLLTSNGATTVSSTVASVPSGHTIDPTRMLRVEVPDGQTIRFEVMRNGSSTTASTNSMALTGRDNIQFGPNWTFNFVDASAV